MTEQEELDYEMPEEIDLAKRTVICNPYPGRAMARELSEAESRRLGRKVVMVALDSDVAEVYQSDVAVNQELRKLIKDRAVGAQLQDGPELAKAS